YGGGCGCLTECRTLAHRGNEAVAVLGHGLQITRALGIVLERSPNLPDGEVETVLEIYVGFRTPHLLSQLLSGNHLSSTADQNRKNYCGLRLELQSSAVAAKLSGAAIQFILAEEDCFLRPCLCCQKDTPTQVAA